MTNRQEDIPLIEEEVNNDIYSFAMASLPKHSRIKDEEDVLELETRNEDLGRAQLSKKKLPNARKVYATKGHKLRALAVKYEPYHATPQPVYESMDLYLL
jgi:hypothetical protein